MTGPAPLPETTRRRLGVVGTLVWDTIEFEDDRFAEWRPGTDRPDAEGEGRSASVEAWGGLAYALIAFDAVLAPHWDIVPIIKIGSDLSESALEFLELLPRMDLGSGLRVVPEPNNRVELRYPGGSGRAERLTGGVPPWSWTELQPAVLTCDALYINFISGFEMELETAQMLKKGVSGPVYADLHSLFLGVGPGGRRWPRALPSAEAWLHCFDAVQMNEEEFGLLGAASSDPWAYAASHVGPNLRLVAVTLGARGAGYLAHPDAEHGLFGGSGSFRQGGEAGARSGASERAEGRVLTPEEGPDIVRVASERNAPGDPTGCGDVWGATFFARLLSGEKIRPAMTKANRMASLNLEYRGAPALARHLTRSGGSKGGP